MSFDSHTNFANGVVSAPPSPSDSGLTFVMKSGNGAKFTGTIPYNCTVQNPTGEQEIIRVTALVGDTITAIRGQEGTTPISVASGAIIFNSATAKTFTDIENTLNSVLQSVPRVQDGFGVVNGNLTIQDIPYLQSIGIKAVRMGGVTNNGWYFNWNYANRNLAMAYKAAGFWVQYDMTALAGGTPLTPTNWAQFEDSCVAEATYLTQIGVTFDAFGIGNELENYLSGSFNLHDLYNGVQNLASRIKAVYSGKVTYNYADYNFASSMFQYGPLGNLDMCAFHPYCSITYPTVPTAFTPTNSIGWVPPTRSDVANLFPYALSFGDYGNTSVDIGAPLALTDYTWCSWVRPAGLSGVLWSNGFNSGSNLGQQLTLNGSSFVTVNQGSSSLSTGSPTFSSSTWMFVCLTQAGNQPILYINGIPQSLYNGATLTLNQVGQDTTHGFLGASNGSSNFFTGQMCGVGIWNRALTPTEVKNLMVGTYPASGLQMRPLDPTGTVVPATCNIARGEALVDSWFAGLGSKAYITEFNLSSDGLAIATLTATQQAAYMKTFYNYIQTKAAASGNNGIVLFYKYTGTNAVLGGNSADGFNLKHTDGTISPMLSSFLKGS